VGHEIFAVVFLSANFVGECLLPLCGETVSMAVVPVFEIVFLIITGNQHSVCEAMPCFLAVVRESKGMGEATIKKKKKKSCKITLLFHFFLFF